MTDTQRRLIHAAQVTFVVTCCISVALLWLALIILIARATLERIA